MMVLLVNGREVPVKSRVLFAQTRGASPLLGGSMISYEPWSKLLTRGCGDHMGSLLKGYLSVCKEF